MYSDSKALNSYLREIGQIEQLSPTEMRNLCSEFDAASELLRSLLGRFGFTASEYLNLLDACLEGETVLTDVFMPSGFAGVEKERGNQMLLLKEWRNEIKFVFDVLTEKFSSGMDCSAVRDDLSKILCRYPVSAGKANEMYEVLAGYLKMAADFPRDPFSPGGIAALADIEGDSCDLLERKLLMHKSEIPEEIKNAGAVFSRFQKLRNRMAEANLRLVISIAQKYRNRGVPFSDLIQEGNLGLLHALERFDFRLGYKFSTYASWWIRHHISRVVAEQSRVIRLPGHMIKTISDINRAQQRFIQLHGREPELDELAKMLELPVARVSAVCKMAQQPISLQSSVGDDDSVVLEEFIAADDVFNPTRELAQKMLYDQLYTMLKTLPEREQQIIIMRFGFFGQPCLPLNEISQRFNLTRERIRQLEVKILTKLRSPEYLKFLDGGVF